jgi:hypothetical protein
VPQEIERETVGCVVAALAVLLEALHHDPVNVTTQCAWQLGRVGVSALRGSREFRAVECLHAHRGSHRINLADHAPHFVHADAGHGVLFDRRVSGEQLVEQHTERVDVAARVDIERRSFPPARATCRAACPIICWNCV